MREILTEKYGKHIRHSQEQRENMSKFLTNMKNGDVEQQKRMDEVLRGGSKTVKRQHVDDPGSSDDTSTVDPNKG